MRMRRLGLLALLLLAVLLTPNPYWRERKRALSCQGNVKLLTQAMLRYAHDNNDRLPAERKWQEALLTVTVKGGYRQCYGDIETSAPTSYAMVARYGGVRLSEIADPGSAILVYEVQGSVPSYRHRAQRPPPYINVCGFIRYYLKRPGMNLGYADGHVRWSNRVTPEMLAEGRDQEWANENPRLRTEGEAAH